MLFLKSSRQQMQDLARVSGYILRAPFGVTHIRSDKLDLVRRNLNLPLSPFRMLVRDFRVDTEKSDGAGSYGIGGGDKTVPAAGGSSCARYLSYSENDRLLLANVRPGVVWAAVSSCSFEERLVMPVDALLCEPDDAVRWCEGTVMADSHTESCAA